MKIVWSDEANEGLDEIIEYLENNWTDREIKNFFIRLEACLDKIAEAPHRQKDSLRKPGTKEYQHSPQTTIFYSYDNNHVNILRVWMNAKDSDNL
ncbi:MAG: type II toxin-antitoxin system RelE/ParE family toxin [Cyclobacteriaceae bacterium]|nr:type II toxin-antitoxin system RelE/ParE family toxin [Cyclobacteriaceae bacterium]